MEPYREWYAKELWLLERRWEHELDKYLGWLVEEVHPIRVTPGWIELLKTEWCPVTVEHNKLVADLDAEFMVRTASIWEKYDSSSFC